MTSSRVPYEEYLPDWLATRAPIDYINTTPLTKFERAMVLGHRALQIAQNNRPRVPVPMDEEYNPLEVARSELDTGVLPPTSVLRYLPNGQVVRKSVLDIYVHQRL